ncbi:MAG: hypothetical protein E7056_05655 [Lentisphaerae bacterium]|nr:hypothetical protein [Lentisphaerota bacterium]
MAADHDKNDPLKFLKTIYLGDRGVTGISMDSVRKTVKIHIDCISRVRGENWNYYTDEDLENGAIVFIGCKKFFFDTNGILPSDFIEIESVEQTADDEYSIVFDVSSYSFDEKRLVPAKLKIIFQSVHLESCDGKVIDK